MRVLITGAAGFLGRRLALALVERGRLSAKGGEAAISELALADRQPALPPSAAPMQVRSISGDLAEPGFVDGLAHEGFDSIFHLAASLTLEAERAANAAWAVNVEALRRLVSVGGCAAPPRLVFASSIAAFGGALPESVDDAMRPTPTTRYGTHKAIAELLLADAARRGEADARSLRLPIVLTRPGAPAPSVSDRIAAIIREPLAGREAICPVKRETVIPVASAGAVCRALIALHELPQASLPPSRVMNLPSLSIAAGALAEAVARRAGAGPIRFAPDPALQEIIDGWPRRFVSAHAAALGIGADADIEALIDDHLRGQA